MHFTVDWFSEHIETWRKYIALPPCPSILEIGCLEGCATCWMLKEYRPTNMVCIDTWNAPEASFGRVTSKEYDLFLCNVNEADVDSVVRVLQAKSQDVLASGLPHLFDLVYVDGSHEAKDVLLDACLSWRMLVRNGYVVFDDYLRRVKHANIHPSVGIDAFVKTHAPELTVLHVGSQVIVRKRC